MKFSHFVELITVKKSQMNCTWKLAIFLVIHSFTGFASTINAEFEIISFNVLFGQIDSLINAQFAKANINIVLFL